MGKTSIPKGGKVLVVEKDAKLAIDIVKPTEKKE